MPHNVSPLRVVLLGTEAADGTLTGVTEGDSQPINCRGFTAMTLYFIGQGTTINAGVVTVEECDYDPKKTGVYSGTWDATTTVNASGASGGAQDTYHYTAGQCWSKMRVRITTPVDGTGTPLLAVVLVAQ